jgi:hypothetical protein
MNRDTDNGPGPADQGNTNAIVNPVDGNAIAVGPRHPPDPKELANQIGPAVSGVLAPMVGAAATGNNFNVNISFDFSNDYSQNDNRNYTQHGRQSDEGLRQELVGLRQDVQDVNRGLHKRLDSHDDLLTASARKIDRFAKLATNASPRNLSDDLAQAGTSALMTTPPAKAAAAASANRKSFVMDTIVDNGDEDDEEEDRKPAAVLKVQPSISEKDCDRKPSALKGHPDSREEDPKEDEAEASSPSDTISPPLQRPPMDPVLRALLKERDRLLQDLLGETNPYKQTPRDPVAIRKAVQAMIKHLDDQDAYFKDKHPSWDVEDDDDESVHGMPLRLLLF